MKSIFFILFLSLFIFISNIFSNSNIVYNKKTRVVWVIASSNTKILDNEDTYDLKDKNYLIRQVNSNNYDLYMTTCDFDFYGIDTEGKYILDDSSNVVDNPNYNIDSSTD